MMADLSLPTAILIFPTNSSTRRKYFLGFARVVEGVLKPSQLMSRNTDLTNASRAEGSGASHMDWKFTLV